MLLSCIGQCEENTADRRQGLHHVFQAVCPSVRPSVCLSPYWLLTPERQFADQRCCQVTVRLTPFITSRIVYYNRVIYGA